MGGNGLSYATSAAIYMVKQNVTNFNMSLTFRYDNNACGTANDDDDHLAFVVLNDEIEYVERESEGGKERGGERGKEERGEGESRRGMEREGRGGGRESVGGREGGRER